MESQSDRQLALQGGKKVRDLPWPDWPSHDEGTESALHSVLRSGRWTISGPDRALYERLEQLRADGRIFVGKPQQGSLELEEVGLVQGQN